MGEPKFKKGQVSATREYEIADSLMENSKRAKDSAYDQISAGKGAIKNGVGDKQLPADGGDWKLLGRTLSGKDRLKIGQERLKQSSADSTKSVRIKSAADNAMKAAQSNVGGETKGFSYKLKK